MQMYEDCAGYRRMRLLSQHSSNWEAEAGKGGGIPEFKASSVYRLSSRTARATQENPDKQPEKQKILLVGAVLTT